MPVKQAKSTCSSDISSAGSRSLCVFVSHVLFSVWLLCSMCGLRVCNLPASFHGWMS